MDRFICLLIGFISLSSSGWNVISAEPEVTVDPESFTIHSGDPIIDKEITCDAEVTIADLINEYNLYWIGPDGRTLNKLADNEDGVSTEKYSFRIAPRNSRTILTMTIKSFDGGDAGTYRCELSTKRANNPIRVSANFVAKAMFDISMLELKINDKKFEETVTDPVQLTENTYSVVCVTKGSNPAADISLSIHSKDGNERPVPPQLSTLPSLKVLDGRVETFDVRYEQQVGLSEDDDKITCKAEVPNTDFLAKHLSVGLQVLSIDPIFECGNASAEVGEENVLITCKIISYHPMTSYGWFEGNDNNVITRNASSTDNLVHIEHKDGKEKDEEGKYIIATSIEIRKAQSYLFSTMFFLEAEAHHGEFYRHQIKLKKEYTYSSSSVIYSSLIVLIAALLLTYVSH